MNNINKTRITLLTKPCRGHTILDYDFPSKNPFSKKDYK